jgi:sialate O-acetylesterase
MIHPIEKYTFQGAIWYQGESNASRAYQYRELFPLMINDWRKQFENPDLSFLFVQLANFMQVKDKPQESAWAELREAQTMTLELPKTGMAVTIDIGEADDIHPRNKQDVGYRLALAARHIEYGQNIVYSGPVYSSMQVEGNKVKLTFNHIGSGLVAKNKFGCLMGFQIAAEDKQWHWAKAYIENDKVIVHSENVQKPVAVRYAWADNPEEANLYNVEGLPASPFKTDSWKGITR